MSKPLNGLATEPLAGYDRLHSPPGSEGWTKQGSNDGVGRSRYDSSQRRGGREWLPHSPVLVGPRRRAEGERSATATTVLSGERGVTCGKMTESGIRKRPTTPDEAQNFM